MTVLVVASRHDIAGQNIAEQLVRAQQFKPVSGKKTLLRHEIEDVYLLHVDSDSVYTNELHTTRNRVRNIRFATSKRS
jgi:D-tyrosyl-tRNA(Tyr) deacylase